MSLMHRPHLHHGPHTIRALQPLPEELVFGTGYHEWLIQNQDVCAVPTCGQPTNDHFCKPCTEKFTDYKLDLIRGDLS